MRVLLKVSGEALAWEKWSGLDYVMLDKVCDMIKELTEKKIEVWIVVWAWNFIRGAEIEKINIDRCNADNMGMLAININAIALADVLVRKWIDVRQVNSFAIDWISERFNKPKTIKSLKKWHVVIFWWWTGNPYFTTDTAGVLRALEIEADIMIKATKVDWVYDKDPIKYTEAKFIKNATYDEVITKNLKVMDATSIALAKENSMLVKVVSLYKKNAVLNAIIWNNEGTTIHDK
jgi:uridylate kinase